MPNDSAPFLRVDLTDMGQAIDALCVGAGIDDLGFRKPIGKVDAVIHLAALAAPGLATEEVTFKTNLVSTYNVFSAATRLGLRKVVWASSETTFGLPFRRVSPAFVPVDEHHPLQPESTYALTKVLAEEMARQMHRWNPSTAFIGLRISNVKSPSDYPLFKKWHADLNERKWNLWGYVDARDVASACVCALECDFSGAGEFIVAAQDTVMDTPSRDLMAAVYPHVSFKRGITTYETLLSNEQSERILGYRPKHSWRNHI